MKKFINESNAIVEDMIEGFVLANEKEFVRIPGQKAYRKRALSDKVIVMSNGGAGCEPMHIGYVGKGMGDATCVGEVFAAPSAYAIYETAKATERGKGVLLICGNFAGDYLNGDMALELLKLDGIDAALVLVRDDVTSAPQDRRENRGGTAGIINVIKIAGAASEAGCALDEVKRLSQKAADCTASVPVVLYSGVNPETGKRMFDMPENAYELGMGFNGEPGIARLQMTYAREIVLRVFRELDQALSLARGQEVCVLVNSMGATSYMELLILYKELHALLAERGVIIRDVKIGRYLTSQEMGGCSITLTMLDKELKPYFDMEAFSPAYVHSSREALCEHI